MQPPAFEQLDGYPIDRRRTVNMANLAEFRDFVERVKLGREHPFARRVVMSPTDPTKPFGEDESEARKLLGELNVYMRLPSKQLQHATKQNRKNARPTWRR